jgi:uncharacterized membrane protein YeaQ/YmgE (transglycosylase-associated protein family)
MGTGLAAPNRTAWKERDAIVRPVLTAIIGAFVLFALYRRFRRTVGRQKVTTKRFIFRTVLLGVGGSALLASLLAGAGLLPLIYALVGLGVGAGATLYRLRLTEFERAPEGGVYFTPNLYLGLAVSALFVGRLLYRFVFPALVDFRLLAGVWSALGTSTSRRW